MYLLLLCCFAFLAGFIDAIVGGGGLVQLPAFFILFPQLSLVNTLATNKTASFLGTCVSAVRFVKRVKLNWKHLWPTVVFAFIGSFGGALLVSRVHKEQFMPFIIFILALVLLYTIFKKELGLHHTERSLSRKRTFFYSFLTGGLVGFYDGLIGPGTGSFLIFAFVVLFGYNFLHGSASAKLVNCVTNFSALLFFFIQGSIIWAIAVPVALSNMLGNYVGSHIALKRGSGFVRLFFMVIVLALILKLGYDHL